MEKLKPKIIQMRFNPRNDMIFVRDYCYDVRQQRGLVLSTLVTRTRLAEEASHQVLGLPGRVRPFSKVNPFEINPSRQTQRNGESESRLARAHGDSLRYAL